MVSRSATRRRPTSPASRSDPPADPRAGDSPAGGAGEPDLAAIRAALDGAWRATETHPDFKAEATLRLKDWLSQRRERVRTELEAGAIDGRDAADAIAALTDDLVTVVIEDVALRMHRAPNPTRTERIALVAVGGYGRGEMAPFSDIDLLFLTPYKQTAWGESVIETTLYVLWDLKCKVGHSVRSIDECLRQARADMTVRTALLEKRFVWGEQALFDELDGRIWPELFDRTRAEFVESKLAERDARHEQAGGSRYLVEPNVKESKGGLRDLQTLWWIARYLYHEARPERLVALGVFEEEEVEIFDAAEAFLWTVRCQLHYVAGRAQEQLTFDRQIEVAERMGYAAGDGLRGVERFMRDYFRHAQKVGELTRFFCAALESQHAKRRPGIGSMFRALSKLRAGSPIEGLTLRDGRLAVEGEDFFDRDPVNLLRIFEAALGTGALIHPTAFRLITRKLDLVDEALRTDPEANRIFLDLLTSRKNPERALRRMHETGVLSRFIPEFGGIAAMMQFNMYHHYTVDEHTITAIRVLHRIEAGELDDELPIASSIMRGGVNRRVLFLATFLHDIGKGRTRPHSEVGAEIAARLGPRLGLGEDETETVVWLVRHHLLMSDIAQRRDISDPKTIRAFADEVQSPGLLKLLLVLTACDIRAVGPNVWNNWKAQLLRQVYRETYSALTGGHPIGSRDERVGEAKAALGAALAGKGWSEEEVAAQLDRRAPAYWLSLDTETHVQFAELVRGAAEDRLLTRFEPDASHDATKACFFAPDHPGLFSRLSGALALCGANVVKARSFTLSDGTAALVFWIQDHDGRPYEAGRIDRLRRTIERTLMGEVVTRDALREKHRVRARERPFTVPTRVSFDNDASDIFTVIEVSARDRLGLLHDLTRTLTANNVNIFSAIIATYGERAVDVFYVKDLFGLKIANPSKHRTVERSLREVIDRAAADLPAPLAAG